MKKTSREKGEIKYTLRFAQSNSQIKSHKTKRLGKSVNSAFRGKRKGQNSFAYLKKQVNSSR